MPWQTPKNFLTNLQRVGGDSIQWTSLFATLYSVLKRNGAETRHLNKCHQESVIWCLQTEKAPFVN